MGLTNGLKSNLKQFFCLTRSKIFPKSMLSIRTRNLSPQIGYLWKIANLLFKSPGRLCGIIITGIQEIKILTLGKEKKTRREETKQLVPTFERQE